MSASLSGKISVYNESSEIMLKQHSRADAGLGRAWIESIAALRALYRSVEG